MNRGYWNLLIVWAACLVWGLTGCTDDAPKASNGDTFIKFYGDPDVNSVPVTLSELSDGLVVVGHVERLFVTEKLQPFIFRTDPQGIEIWNTTIDLVRFESAVGNAPYDFKPATDTLNMLDLAVGSEGDFFLLHSLSILNTLNNNEISFFAMTKVDQAGNQVWNKYYPNAVNGKPVAFVSQNGTINILSSSPDGILISETNESGDLLQEALLDTEEQFPGATLFPRGMVQKDQDLIVLCDGFESGPTVAKGLFLVVNSMGIVVGGNPTAISFPEEPWAFGSLIRAGDGFGTMISGSQSAKLVKFNQNRSISWSKDIDLEAGRIVLSDQISATDDGSLLLSGSSSAGPNSQMLIKAYSGGNGREQQILNFGPAVGSAFSQKTLKKSNLGMAILGVTEVDRNDVITLISTDSAGEL